MKNEIEYEAIINSYRKQVEEIGEVKFPKKVISNKIRRVAETSFLVGCLTVYGVSAVSHNAEVKSDGKGYIYHEYPVSDIMSSHNVSIRSDTTSGLVVTMNRKQVSFDYFINVMMDSMRRTYPGITDAEMKISLENAIPASLDNYFKDVTSNDINKTIEAAYHRMKEEKAREGLGK